MAFDPPGAQPPARSLALTIRVEHGACGTMEDLAIALVSLASRTGLTVRCNVNETGVDMWAMPGLNPSSVVKMWRDSLKATAVNRAQETGASPGAAVAPTGQAAGGQHDSGGPPAGPPVAQAASTVPTRFANPGEIMVSNVEYRLSCRGPDCLMVISQWSDGPRARRGFCSAACESAFAREHGATASRTTGDGG